jgi:hypothetical protein
MISKCVGLVGELPPEQLVELETRLKSTHDQWGSTIGFMSPNENLLDVYNTDLQLIESYGLTFKQIADRLQTLIEKYKRKLSLISHSHIHFNQKIAELSKKQIENLSTEIINMKCNSGYECFRKKVKYMNPLIIDQHYVVTRISFWSSQPCPFVGGLYGKSNFLHIRDELGGGDDYWIYDLRTGQSLKFNDLQIHLIRDHGFFEGHVYHRLEPFDVITFFHLKPDIDYSPTYFYETQWICVNQQDNISFNQKERQGQSTIINIQVKDDYVLIETQQIKENDDYYDIIINNFPLRHRLLNKKISKYKKNTIKYVQIQEENCD